MKPPFDDDDDPFGPAAMGEMPAAKAVPEARPVETELETLVSQGDWPTQIARRYSYRNKLLVLEEIESLSDAVCARGYRAILRRIAGGWKP